MLDTLTQIQHYALATLKHNLVPAPVLALPRFKRHLILDKVANNKQISCVWEQEQPEKTGKPLSILSSALTAAEHSYDKAHREILTVVWAGFLAHRNLESH